MPKTIRSNNLSLIRWLNHGHTNTSNKLNSITNSNYISKMTTGDMEISDYQAREIEKTLQLPSGWMDRDNAQLLKIDETEFKILSLLTDQSLVAKDGLLCFLSASKK
jgi:hypothetical protein